MSGCVKGFGCRPVRAGSDRAEGRRLKASRGGSRGPGRGLWGFRRAAWWVGSCEARDGGAMLRLRCPEAGDWRRRGRIWDHHELCFRHRADRDRPLSGRARSWSVRVSLRRHRHDVSILTARMVRGAVPGAKRSTRIMRPPQQGQGGLRSSTGSDRSAEIAGSRSAVVVACVAAAMICLMRTMVSARRLEASRP